MVGNTLIDIPPANNTSWYRNLHAVRFQSGNCERISLLLSAPARNLLTNSFHSKSSDPVVVVREVGLRADPTSAHRASHL
jgi:hypothetical protein